MFSLLSGLVSQLSSIVPAGLIQTIAISFMPTDGSNPYMAELIGTILMVALTFSPGKWIFADAVYPSWAVHALGVIAADKIGGGQHVNPSVSVSMYALGKCSYSEMILRISGAMAGGLVAFPLCQILSDFMGWTPLGGPEYNPAGDEDASASGFNEFASTLLLCFLIYIVNWELNFGKYHYWIKQSLTAFGIRFLIVAFPTSGPAMNPMLGTTWAVFSSGGVYPTDVRHYFVYWVASMLGAVLASFCYAVYDGCTFFGQKLPFGPIKSKAKVSKKKD
jgi:glycerol uptake facilitator-like aquaporin